MPTTETRARSHPRPPTVRVSVAVCAALLAMVSTVSTVSAPAARAEPGGDELPSRGDVERSRDQVAETAGDVAAVRSRLAAADAELDAAAVRAAQAFEAYNGARWAVQQATTDLRRAREEARAADRQVNRQRLRLAELVATTYQGAGDLPVVDAVLGSDGPEGLMTELLHFEGASSSLDAGYQRYSATATLADVFREEAEEALARQRTAMEDAEQARAAAEAAAAAAQRTATAIAEEKERLVTELARLQGISTALARRRQQLLEERAQRLAALDAARDARPGGDHPDGDLDGDPAGEQPDGEQPAGTDRTPVSGEQRDGREGTESSRPGREPRGDSAPEPPTRPGPDPAPEPTSAPPPAGDAGRALQFARAQLGEPYVWGAAGPSAWDCSGLTMRAWQAAGVTLPHYSVAQYAASTPISVGQLRPGDLVFWGSSSSPSSIFHVALYLGDGMILHAPRTGRPVSVDSMYYWVPPTFFGRV